MNDLYKQKKFYISTREGKSGITRYSRDFYELVLKDLGYIFIDSADSIVSILSAVASLDEVYIEAGIFQRKELKILFTMLRANYKNVSVTLHDAPLVKYPFYDFSNPFFQKLSKAYDKFANSGGAVIPYLKKIKTIYVLSRKGQQAVKDRYKIEHVHYLPHIVDTNDLNSTGIQGKDLLYFGFIGRNKGIEYALQLHQELLLSEPGLQFYIVGEPIGKEKEFYSYLKERYQQNVQYLGYVPDDKLAAVFSKAAISLLLFQDFKFYWPVSGSILNILKKGKIVFTNKVNAVPELIDDQQNGFFLSGKKEDDAKKLLQLINDRPLLEAVQKRAFDYLKQHHSAEAVRRSLIV